MDQNVHLPMINSERPTDQVIHLPVINANLSPDAFHRFATHYYKCKNDFRSPHRFSPVPYFLLCRAIELELKARHLRYMGRNDVKDKYGHNLVKAYEALNSIEKILNNDELNTLVSANNIYKGKGFEYFEPEDALTAYKRYPDLQLLDSVAKKLIDGNI
jgi:hypothetical protein